MQLTHVTEGQMSYSSSGISSGSDSGSGSTLSAADPYTYDNVYSDEDASGDEGAWGGPGAVGPHKSSSALGGCSPWLVYNARAVFGGLLLLALVFYASRLAIVADKTGRKFESSDNKFDANETNEATPYFLQATELAAVVGCVLVVVGVMHIMHWNVITRMATAAVALISFALEVNAMGFAIKMWQVGKSDVNVELADEFSGIAGLTVAAVVVLAVIVVILLLPALSQTFGPSETFEHDSKFGAAGEKPKHVVFIAASILTAVELFRLVVLSLYHNSNLRRSLDNGVVDANANNNASPQFMDIAMLASAVTFGFIFAAFVHLRTWHAASRIMATATGFLSVVFNIWAAAYMFKVWDLGSSNIAGDLDSRVTMAGIATLVQVVFGGATIFVVDYFVNFMNEADVGDAQDTSDDASFAALKRAGRKIVAGLTAFVLLLALIELVLMGVFFDNLIDNDLSFDSINVAAVKAYSVTITSGMFTVGVALLAFVHVWKWNVLTGSSAFAFVLVAFALNGITAGYSARSLDHDDTVRGTRTVKVDNIHVAFNALSFVLTAALAALAAAVSTLRGGYDWADEADLAYRQTAGPSIMAAGAVEAGSASGSSSASSSASSSISGSASGSNSSSS
ncbi:uncharacterized protein AMSG_04529 [Thecamonas trahens ATCC 50062]|uniref:Transmembrane protein n=1 Tax=Thecamonas trahens ATCC 50062 TaxID=461836 RepID=A0A0L0DAG8_THETB|nr:hypothetical protein AMSG_04529 [Thecamonas trahens ATCC 50062]KNC48298.1 hypothetical protein AMSG_04529 [Thecamonas trahens ATCC 50062]|eukprot:XP_013758865.1 hypothetical protein AMSG_04529 [Thecamonas trahens ATCC 50062]